MIQQLSSLTVLTALFLVSCGNQPKAAKFMDIQHEEWFIADTIVTQLVGNNIVGDTIQVSVRHSADYPFQNIWLGSSINGSEYERYQFILATPSGQWLGKKSGGLYTFTQPTPFVAPSDTVTIKTVQYMRANPLIGVQSIGVRVE